MKITDEMVAEAKRAATDRLMSDDGCPEGEALRAGIEAIAPMIRDAAIEEAARVADALNSDVGCIAEEFYEGGDCYAWDEQAEKNFSHLSRRDPDTLRALATELLAARKRIGTLISIIEKLHGPLTIAALEARANVAETALAKVAWQPIETAHKESSEIILLAKGRAYSPCSWQEGGIISDYWIWLLDPEYSVEVKNPTHWMPIPPQEKQP